MAGRAAPKPTARHRLLGLACLLAALSGARAAWSRSWGNELNPSGAWCPAATAASRVPVGAWGCSGEGWRKDGPLADWSFAGYGGGVDPIPNKWATVDVKKYGARGDGSADDTSAVRAAIEATKANGGVIYFPGGTYKLSGQLVLTNNQVLRGAGRDATTLLFTKSLKELFGWGGYAPGKGNSPWTWKGALITTQTTRQIFKDQMLLGFVTQDAGRGDTRLYLSLKGTPYEGKSAADAFKPGDWMALRMYETSNADLAKSLINYRATPGHNIAPMFGNRIVFTHNTRITAAGSNWVEFERPLTVDVKHAFSPLLYKTPNFYSTGVGVEDLQIWFPWTAYPGHHEEAGYNAIEYISTVNSWVRRVRIVNADAAIKVFSSMFNTISDVQITNSPRKRRGGAWSGRTDGYKADKDGHMGIALHWGCFDNLVEKFDIQGLYYHELLVAGYSAHNVFMNGRGEDMTLDHHGAAPHNNLWTNIDVGLGNATYDWSGDPGHKPYGGSNNVFWNIYASDLGRRTQERGSRAVAATPEAAAGAAAAKPGAAAARKPAAPAAAGPDGPLERPPASRRLLGTMAAWWVQRRLKRLTAGKLVWDRPASDQGYAQTVVDVPLDTNMRFVKEAGDWLVSYDPYKPVWPPNLWEAQRKSQSKRLRVAWNKKLPTNSYL